jgi:MFS family permease
MSERATRRWTEYRIANRLTDVTPVKVERSSHVADRKEVHLSAILALLSFAMMIVSLDQYIVVVALPDIARDLGYSPQTLQSVVSAYAIASSGFVLLGGRASDLLGRRRILLVGLFLYLGASLAAGLASSVAAQLAGRAVQGLGGALVFPSTLALISVMSLKAPTVIERLPYGRAPERPAW